MSDVDPAALDWLDRYAAAIGVPAPSLEEVTALLSLAGHGGPRLPPPGRPGRLLARGDRPGSRRPRR